MHSGIALWGRVIPEKGKYTYQGHLVMFPSGWGFYDLFRRNGLPVDGKPAQKVGKQHDWNNLEILAQGNRIRLVVNGSLVADWVRDRVYHVGLERTDSSPGLPAPAWAGDRFLAEWIYWRQTWSNRGHLRDPLAATAVRATCTVARALGLRWGSHQVRTSVC